MIVQDSDYLNQLEIIRRIRDAIVAGDEIDLPQICVIGDQSSGKSSFLSRLTGVSFPTAAKMCTKAATVVTCTRDATRKDPMYEIEDVNNPGVYVKVSCTAKAIQDTQDTLLNAGGGQSNADENRIITDRSIKLRVTGPHVIDIIIVDLPGIQHAGPTKDAITTLIEKNIEKSETLNLIVSEAKQDAELTKAIELAAKYDPSGERTIRVLSKFDNFDTHDTRNRAVDFIKSGLESIGSTDTKALSHQINLGPHAVISIGSDGKLRSSREGEEIERKQLVEDFTLPESRAGIATLKERLQPVFAILIKKNLPVLKQTVSNRLNETQLRLEKVGKTPLTPFELMYKCHGCLLDKTESFLEDLTRECFLPMKDQIHAVKKEITFEFATANFEMNSFHCILFQGQSTFNEVVKKIRELWEPVVNEYVKRTSEVAMASVYVLKDDACTRMYGPLISGIRAEYQAHLQEEVLPRFHDACLSCLHEEGFFGTTNHYFDAKFLEDEICPEALVDRFIQKANVAIDNETVTNCPHSSCRRQIQGCSSIDANDLRECLKAAKQEIATEAVHSDLMTNQKNRLFSAVKAHFDVEKKTFVDNLLKKTKDILIRGRLEWIERDLLRSENILHAAKEDESVKKYREDLQKKIDRLEECMSLLVDVELPKKRRIDEGPYGEGAEITSEGP